MGWKVEDLSKPQIMVESTFGDSHPGSAHLDQFVKEAVQAVNDNGGKAARYFASDMCDGIAQGHDGINYSLPHRDAIVNLVEAQANASVYDGGVFIASCDKSVPAMLMSIGRLKDMSAIVVTGGVMEAHTLPKEYVVNDPACAINELLTLEQIGKFDAWEKTGVIPNSQLDYYKHNACPSCGACSFMGTASTMQIMAEALGLMLPGTALMPATAPELKQAAYDAGKQLMELVKKGITAKDIVTKKSFENAIMVHAAISGSTNATMHLPAIAHEFGIEIDADTFDRMHRGAHYLLNIRPSGDWPAQYFYYAGGVPRVMEEIKSMLHLDVMTVTGKTLGENLEDLKKNGFYEHCDEILQEKTKGLGIKVTREDIIHSYDNAKGTDGSIAILKGNLAPEGSVIKHTACPKNMFHATLRAKPFDSEEECISAVLNKQVQPGDAIFIRYEGPRGSGMPMTGPRLAPEKRPSVMSATLEASFGSVNEGIGNTLKGIALLVGLGSMFGAILEESGGAQTLAVTMVRKFGDEKAAWALGITGLVVAMPVFFDAGLIILIPLAFSLAKRTKRSVLYYVIPLLAGLAVGHAFIPPTPGPVLLATMLGVDLGWVILIGIFCGIFAMIAAGPIWGSICGKKYMVEVPEHIAQQAVTSRIMPVGSRDLVMIFSSWALL